ncbi:MAG TPA: MFS transporter [Acidimicrobiia bacterium]|nr:MFS transporter [Acidimicrobiia bacterium]
MSSSTPSDSPAAETGRWGELTALLAAQAVAWTGTRLAGIAVPWFVLTTTGSAVRTGAVVFAQMAPYVISQAVAGPVIDRVGPRRISLAGDLVATVAIGLIPVLYLGDLLAYPVLLALLAVVGAAEGPANAARGVFVPSVTERAGIPLERATGLVGTVERTAAVVGPAVGGVVVAAWGGATSLVITAALSLASALIIWKSMPSQPAVPASKGNGYLDELREGARFLMRERLLRSIMGMVAVTNLIDSAAFSVLLPVWAAESGRGPAVIGLLASVMSGASIGSSLLSAAYGHRFPRRLTYVLGFIIGGPPRLAILAVDTSFAAVVAVYAVAGFANGVLNPIIGAVQFERIPAQLLGRVRTLGGSLAWSGIPFGGVIAGAMVATIGLSPALLIMALAYLVTTTLPGLLPEWAEMNRDPAGRAQRESR